MVHPVQNQLDDIKGQGINGQANLQYVVFVPTIGPLHCDIGRSLEGDETG